MTTARDIATTICNAAGKDCGCDGHTCARIAEGLLASESVRLELAAKLNPWRPIELPKCVGFYWAKWKIAAEGTREGDELTPSDSWEVMQVFINCVDQGDDEYLMVSVPGVEKAQALESFYWGYGPLPAPPA